MIIYNNKIKNIKNNKAVIAIGNFDGLHLGHQKVLLQALNKARKNNLKFGVITFEPLPVMFFNKKKKNYRINNFSQKIYSLKKLKVDFVYVVKFNKKFSFLSPDKFIEKILINKLKSKFVFVSKNFKFGKNRTGNINTLKQNEDFFNFKTIITKPLKIKNKILSSSKIRNEISNGKINSANKFLGRPWCVEGKVEEGNKRGRKIGFPTCNIKWKNYILPKLGVYSVEVLIGKKQKKGIANIGYRPTFRGKKLLLEINIFNLKANLYKKTIKVIFKKFIRPEKKFNSVEELKMQIKKDIKRVKK
ncbi:MAG: bifunctional riboflavin kinase/FAD synthetase [Pelagibacteraceae bacterium]